ncbi:cytochrome P450 [Guyanagaster necrorhizus]|uniref:Cytochrome P450 n=1 Tax=Guyanagaster necrorhizus TaxID=856835 RepID=A0A9P8ARA2_9AGAR|nr:cytochrome P450 [Guyanagaster necrorhizus MCA 3950]KAG7444666.1 cytochrome P450 [Guyanagaster necrorhizus MCA 3950]
MTSFMELLNKAYGHLSTFTIPGWGRLVVINRTEWLAHVKKSIVYSYESTGPVALSIFEQFPGLGTPVASEGEKWRASRKAIQPIFGVKSFQDQLATAMSDVTYADYDTFFVNATKDRLPFDWNDSFGRLALSIFVKSNFNLDTTMLQEDPKALTDSHELISSICELNEISAACAFIQSVLLDGTWFRFRRTISVLWEAIDGLIEERSKSLALAGDVDSQETDFFSTFLKSHSETNPVFTRNIMQPEWLNRMREETIALGQSGQGPTFATLSACALLASLGADELTSCHLTQSYVIHLAAFYETVRLWPGLPKNARYATAGDILPAVPELSIPETNIEKGTYVLWSDKIIMRDPLVWGPDADEFNPARHISDDGKFIKPSAPEFITFDAGPRYCPAASIVPYEWVFIWSTLLRLFDFEFLDTSKRSTGDFLANQMADPFMVRVREREA